MEALWFGLVLLTLTVMTGCDSALKSCRTPFNEVELQPYTRAGSSVIAGRVLTKTRAGEVFFPPGSTVVLMPLTAYTRELMERGIIRREKLSAPDYALENYVRRTKTSGDGNFWFSGLPAGSYLVIAASADNGPGSEIMACATTTVANGEMKTVFVIR